MVHLPGPAGEKGEPGPPGFGLPGKQVNSGDGGQGAQNSSGPSLDFLGRRAKGDEIITSVFSTACLHPLYTLLFFILGHRMVQPQQSWDPSWLLIFFLHKIFDLSKPLLLSVPLGPVLEGEAQS